MARLSSPQAKRKAPPTANFASLSQAAVNTPPRNTNGNFKFQDYRSQSPGQLSDESDNDTSLRKPSRALAEVPINTRPVGPRKDKKARFSFVSARNELSGAAKERKSFGRPSILTITEDIEPLGTVVPATAKAGERTAAERSLKSTGIRVSAGEHTSSRSRESQSQESSRLSVSEYYDAAEEQSVVDQMDSIQESEDEEEEDEDGDTTLDNMASMQLVNETVKPIHKQEAIEQDEDEDEEEDNSTQTIMPPAYDSQEDASSDSEEDSDDSDFDDVQEGNLVLRDDPLLQIAGHTPNSQTRLPCTRATPNDTRRLKASAIALVRYEESEDMYAALMDRLQCMTDREEDLAGREGRDEVSLSKLAKRLHSWLDSTKEGRVVTGEKIVFVKHELEWASWIWEAARTGVLHVKGRRCRCKPEWRR